MIIKNAGYMWHREYVNWGKRRLVGTPEKGEGDEENFADQSGVYGLYSKNHECIYIGQAGRGESSGLFDRLKAHAIDDHLFCFWERFTWFGFYTPDQLKKENYDDPIAEKVNVTDALDTIELVGIYLALPRFNRRYETGFGTVIWYYQSEEYEKLKNPHLYRETRA